MQRTNQYPGWCNQCRKSVAAGSGVIARRTSADRWATFCLDHAPEKLAAELPVERRLFADGRLTTPFERENLPLVQAIPGARWNGDGKFWTVSLSVEDRPRLLELADRLGLEVDPSLRQYQVAEPEVDLPDSLYPFQRDGVKFLLNRSKALLADDMGLGKTVQVLFALDASQGTIVIAPASVKYNWRDECKRWRPDLKPVVLQGKDSWRLPEPGEVVVLNYDILPSWLKATEALSQADRERFSKLTLVVDEAHAVKNYKAQRSVKVKGLSGLVGRVWFLTGTPLLTRPGDLYGVLESGGLAFQTFGHFGKFMKLFGAYKDKWGGIKWGSPSPAVPELLRRVMLRRVRTEVLPDLPRKTYQTIVVNSLSAGLRRQLDAIWDDEGDYLDVERKLPDFEQFSKIRAQIAEERIPQVLELVEEHEEQEVPLVVFSAHRAPIDELGKREGWATITGDTPNERRADIVRAFQAGQLKGVALTISAGGVGLTLTHAWRVLFVDLDWTPALNSQAEDRICRIGQRADACEVIRLVGDHPLEQHVHGLIASKIALIQAAIETEYKGAKVPANTEGRPGETEEEYQARVARIAAEVEEARLQSEDSLEGRKARAKARVSSVLSKLRARKGAQKQFEERALTPERSQAIRDALRTLSSYDPDFASEKNGIGFNKIDTRTGHILACTGLETEEELRAAERLCVIYHRQIRDQFPIIFESHASDQDAA